MDAKIVLMDSLNGSTIIDDDNSEPLGIDQDYIVKQQDPLEPKTQQIREKLMRKKRNFAGYNWTKAQHKKYVLFLMQSGQLLKMTQQERKMLKVNLKMSKLIRTRNPVQCHTHHQKMLESFGSIEAIIFNNRHLFEESYASKSKEMSQAIPNNSDANQIDEKKIDQQQKEQGGNPQLTYPQLLVDCFEMDNYLFHLKHQYIEFEPSLFQIDNDIEW